MSDWISVEDELPKDGDSVIVWGALHHNSCHTSNEGLYDSAQETWFAVQTDGNGDCWRIYGVTHWMPMPDGPAPEPTAEEQAADDRTERVIDARIARDEL